MFKHLSGLQLAEAIANMFRTSVAMFVVCSCMQAEHVGFLSYKRYMWVCSFLGR